MTFLSRYQSILLSILRIVAGLLVLQHGTTKLLHFPASQMSGISLTSPPGLAGIVELVCGALVVLGLFTRPAAFLLAGMTAVAYFMVHLPQGIYPLLNGGELVALYCFAFLYISAAGPGPISLDAAMGLGRILKAAMELSVGATGGRPTTVHQSSGHRVIGRSGVRFGRPPVAPTWVFGVIGPTAGILGDIVFDPGQIAFVAYDVLIVIALPDTEIWIAEGVTGVSRHRGFVAAYQGCE